MTSEQRTIAVTGSDGFIGRNLLTRLAEQGFATHAIHRGTRPDDVRRILLASDAVFHLAGVNRPTDPDEFERSNGDYTRLIAKALADTERVPLVVFSSSTKAEEPGEYGRTKRTAEEILLDVAGKGAATVAILRLPNVFGKWARPNYNSVVATLCHNFARGLPVQIDDAGAALALLYIDDLVDHFLHLLAAPPRESGFVVPRPVHRTTVGAVAGHIASFAEGRPCGCVEQVGSGLERALYATFVSALPIEAYSYELAPKTDERGSFTEVLKTPASGQISFLTSVPGAIRGGHYHHSKVEKFVVTQGRARFRFRNIADGQTHEFETSSDRAIVVETIPGWTHDITNVGDDLLICVVWANEIFDPQRPDTVAMPL
jgi:UDP-2-acetamido-2,6-beta-L-arabino-hexul-4-ose reductase